MHHTAPGKPYVEPNIIIKGQRLKVVENSTYLGITPSKSIVIDNEVNTWLTKASADFDRLNWNVLNRRRLGSNHNQGIQSCRSYHPHLWLWNVDNLLTIYKEAKPLSNNLSEEDSRHHTTKAHSRHRNFNSGFSYKHLHHLDAITASLCQSCCLHEWSLPPEQIAPRWAISG